MFEKQAQLPKIFQKSSNMLIKDSYAELASKANQAIYLRNPSKMSFNNVKVKQKIEQRSGHRLQHKMDERSLSTYSVLKIQNRNYLKVSRPS